MSAAVATQSVFRKFMNSPTGPKTIHFWAPTMKWGLVLAGISDISRPAEELSTSQNLSLAVSGLIWTRWCLVITPRNVFLSAINFSVSMTAFYQLSRIMRYRQTDAYKQTQLQQPLLVKN
ncbi:UPF0041-domain-containing protein [Backusella circina FSU 941]|nr:UPF0041-domain-containing protein [Backusella circina FSU 941]